jgi:AcrR family transcriptional regulator
MGVMETRVNRRGAARREALVEAAIELWAATGWRGTGITAVAARAGVTPSGLLHHFGTKEQFLLDVLSELDRRTLAHFDTESPAGGLDALRQLPDMVRDAEDRPGLWKLHLMLQAENLDPDGPAYEYYVRRHTFLHQRFAKAVRRGQEDGDIRPDADPELVATQVLSFLMGSGIHREHGPRTDLVAACQDFTDRLLRDLATTTSPSTTGDQGS